MKVLAVIVTYNRLELLKDCIKYLKNQTCPLSILIVDNASNDGTENYIRTLISQNLYYERMETNLGGAGGFNFGIRWGVEHGFSHIWIMDDDCLPQHDSLEKLVKAEKDLNGEYGWLSSKCIWTDGDLCQMNIQMRSPYSQIKDFSTKLVPAQMASFVSLFLKAETVKEFGLPISDFVIWTDDWEFTRRISREYPCYVVNDSIVTHAMKYNKVANIATDVPERLQRYKYLFRNDVYLYREEGVKGWLWLISKDCWNSLKVLLHGHPERIGMIASGFVNGIRFHPIVEKVENI